MPISRRDTRHDVIFCSLTVSQNSIFPVEKLIQEADRPYRLNRPIKECTMKLINRIVGSITSSNKRIDIQLNGKNLIIAGGNGSGKTSLATSISRTLQHHIVAGTFPQIDKINDNIKILEEQLANPLHDEHVRRNIEQDLKDAIVLLDNYMCTMTLEFNQPLDMIQSYKDKKSSIRFYAANRSANITTVTSATASLPDVPSIDTLTPLGINLEQHLVNLKVRSALALQSGEQGERPLHATEWIESFTKNLKYLFEDQTTELVFAPDQLRFYISQEGKPQYSFQSLSSGYLAIFDIYADLLMHTEYIQLKPEQLSGVVIIDEIDAHLHVSLQRKILPFFTAAFPQIQFIVTTHSPFVLTSVDDAVIFDITTNQTASDLSMFSYESVIEGLLGVPPISKKLEDTINELTTITSTPGFDFNEAQILLKTITPYIDVLDPETEMFYQIAANKILKSKAENS